MPIAPTSFDAIVCRGVLYRVPDLPGAFAQLFTVLRPGGSLVIGEPIDDSRLLRLLRSGGFGNVARTYTSQAWIETAEGAGFRLSSSFNLGYVAWPLVGFSEFTEMMRLVPMRLAISRMLQRLGRRRRSSQRVKGLSNS